MNKILRNNRSILLVLIIALVFVILAIIFARSMIISNATTFGKSGKIITANEFAEGSTYSFQEDTVYKEQLEGGYEFEDVQEKKVVIDEDTFIFYEDGTIATLAQSVLMNVNDIDANTSINHYGMAPNTPVIDKGGSYEIQNGEETVPMEEVLWRSGENKYILLAESINVNFSDDDSRSAGSFIEINFIDKGVVQLVTEDNVWQTVSEIATITTGSGTVINLMDQVVEKNDTKMLMSKLVIDADDNIEVSPLEVYDQEIPEFNVDSEKGESGTSGDQGVTGEEGVDGATGGTGGTGTSGNNAVGESSQYTGLPQIAITEWEVTANSLKGNYSIEDENAMLEKNLTIRLYEAGSEDYIDCVDVNGDSDNFSFFSGTEYFSPSGTPLKPDTEYRFVISGTYTMNDVTQERDFVVKVFYTDSLGIFTTKNFVDTNEVALNVEKKDYSNAQTVDTYLMTVEQAKTFDPTKDETYTSKISTDFSGGAKTELVSFNNLYDGDGVETVRRNTEYVIRTVINNIDGTSHLSEQSLTLKTLKAAPDISNMSPYANPNKQMGAFELYSGNVIDPDLAMVSYQYEIQDTEGNIVKTMDVSPDNVNKAVVLYVDGVAIKYDEEYVFKVKMTYFDNEKMVDIESVMSSEFVISPVNLPSVYLDTTEVEYDKIVGEIVIKLNGSSIDIDVDNPLYISMECEGVFNKTQMIESYSDSSIISYNESEIRITLNERYLNEGQVYRFNITGTVDMKTGSPEEMIIGSIVESTKKTTDLAATWSVNASSSKAVSRVLTLEAEDDSEWNKDSYDAQTLSKVVVEIYSGSGNGKVFMDSAEFVDNGDTHTSDLAEDFIEEGVEITEDTFGIPSSALTGAVYTLKVSEVYDYTVLEDLPDEKKNDGNYTNYVNEYDILTSTQEVVCSKSLNPPELPNMDSLESQVIATPIYNEQAENYGYKIDKDLDDETIIGYDIIANYDNYAKLAREITYYVYEENALNDKVISNINPIFDFDTGTLIEDQNDGQWLCKKTVDVSATSTTVPRMAIMFGEGEDYTFNNTYICFSGEAITSYNPATKEEEIQSGMTRGYKYDFAYTLRYSPTGAGDVDETSPIYPYTHPEFSKLYDPSKTTKAYILRSGAQNAPKTLPEFQAIPWEQSGGTNKYAALDIRYKYSDVDETISDGIGIYYENDTGTGSLGTFVGAVPNQWNTFTISSASMSKLGNYLKAKIECDLYNMNYSEETIYTEFCSIALDNEFEYSNSEITDGLYYKVNTDSLDKNNISVTFSNAGSVNTIDKYKDQIVAVRVTVTEKFDEDNFIIFDVPYQSSTNSINISTSKLEKFLNKTVTLDAKIIYDTGKIGWNLGNTGLSEDAGNVNWASFALQNVKFKNEIPYFDTYIAIDTNSTSIINQGNAANSYFKPMLETEGETAGSRIWIDEDFTNMKYSYIDKFGLATYGKETFAKTTLYGISNVNSDDEDYLYVITPKELGATNNMTLETGYSNEFELDKIVPTVATTSITANLNNATIGGFQVIGYEMIDKKVIDGIECYPVKVTLKKEDGTVVNEQEVYVKTNNQRLTVNFEGLEQATTYQITATALIGGEEISLLDNNSSAGSIWSEKITTKGGIKITYFSANYTYSDYATRAINLSYNLDVTTGVYLEYSILDNNNNVVYTAEDLKNKGMFTGYVPGEAYNTSMNAFINIPIEQEKLLGGNSYKVQITPYLLNTDNTIGEQIAGGQVTTPFEIETGKNPSGYIQMTSVYDEYSEQSDLEISFSVADTTDSIMSDYKNDSTESIYLARLYKVDETGAKVDVTPDIMKNATYKPTTLYTVLMPNAEANTNYIIELYANVDTNIDGKEDSMNYETSIDQIGEEEFEANKDSLMIWEDRIATPGESGISFGSYAIENIGGDKSKIAIGYQNAINLNLVAEIDYSIVSLDGQTVYTGTIDNSGGDEFVQKTAGDQPIMGYYTLALPETLEVKGMYKIIVQYKVKNSSGQLEKLDDRHSLQYYYE